jgi:U3 small nucleolar RNA-associated protein 22
MADATIFADYDDTELGAGASDHEDIDEDADDANVAPEPGADFVLPSAEEMNELKETQELFKSNLFKLQIDELLKEVTVNYDKCESLETFLHSLKSTLDGLADVEVVAEAYQPVLGVPFPIFRDDTLQVTLSKPSRIDLVGSYLLRSNTRPRLNVDVAVELPAQMLGSKDFLNYRYLFKRALYVRYLFSQLQVALPAYTVSLSHLLDDLLKPIILINFSPSEPSLSKAARAFTVRLLPALPPDFFAPRKLGPARNCLRDGRLPEGKSSSASSSATEEVPTPLYNACVLEDQCFKRDLERLYPLANESKGFAQASQLFRVWHHQRVRDLHSCLQPAGGVSEGSEMSGFLFALLLAHLVATKRLAKQASSFQMFRGGLQFLAETPLTPAESNSVVVFGLARYVCLHFHMRQCGICLCQAFSASRGERFGKTHERHHTRAGLGLGAWSSRRSQRGMLPLCAAG